MGFFLVIRQICKVISFSIVIITTCIYVTVFIFTFYLTDVVFEKKKQLNKTKQQKWVENFFISIYSFQI